MVDLSGELICIPMELRFDLMGEEVAEAAEGTEIPVGSLGASKY